MTCLDPKGLQAAICNALLDAFPMADKVADNYAAVAAKVAEPYLSASTTPSGEVEGLVERLSRAISRAEEHAGTIPAKEAVKLAPMDWHSVCKYGREASTALASMKREVEEAWASREWHRVSLEAQTENLREAEARIKVLEEALKPFAAMDTCDGLEDGLFRLHDDHPVVGEGLGDEWRPLICIKHFRAASQALGRE